MDTQKVWNQALDVLRVSVSPANFSTWLANTFIIKTEQLEGSRLLVEVGCPSSFSRHTIEKRYFGLIQDALNQVTGKKSDLVFSVKQNPYQNNVRSTAPLFSKEEAKKDELFERRTRKAKLRPGFTFDNFAVSSSNQVAWAAASAVAKNPGGSYNPLFLWGGVGVGKTHLMLAVGQEILKKDPDTRVLYCTSEEFTTEIIEAIRTKTTVDFKRRYRSVQVLLLDDVQFLAGKTTVQEEFFHTFNTIQREGGQIVLTSDKPPEEIPRLEERLRSRFEGGLTADIAQPDFELRTAILLIKARERGLELPMDIAQLIAANIVSTRRLEGFLVRLLSETTAKKTQITEELVRSLLGKADKEKENLRSIKPQDVISAVSGRFELGRRQLLGPKRARKVALPRQILMYLLRVELGLPLVEVGRLVGGRDHTTVMYAVDKVSALVSENEEIRGEVMGIKRSLSG